MRFVKLTFLAACLLFAGATLLLIATQKQFPVAYAPSAVSAALF